MDIFPGLDSYNSNEELSRVPLFVNYSDPLLTFASVFCGVLMVIGIPGNLITIIALSRYKKVQNATATFIINLQISDLLLCCTMLPIIAATYWEKHWVFGKTICRLFPMLRISLYMVGMFMILAISINRYIMVCHPEWYERIYTKKNIRIMVAVIWVTACAMLFPILFEAWGRFSLDPKVGLCSVVPDHQGNSPKTFLISTFAIPCIVMQVCYTRIWWVARKSSKKSRRSMRANPSRSGVPETCLEVAVSSTSQDDTETGENSIHFRTSTVIRRTMRPKKKILPTRKDRRLGTMIIVIMLTFYVCSVPFVIVKSVSEGLKERPAFNVCGYLMLFVTNSINPIIYVAMSREFRQAYKSLFKSMKTRCFPS